MDSFLEINEVSSRESMTQVRRFRYFRRFCASCQEGATFFEKTFAEKGAFRSPS